MTGGFAPPFFHFSHPEDFAMYNSPTRISYGFNGVDGHTADITKIVRGPKGQRGRLVDILVSITTTTAGATTTPKVQVGTSGALTTSANLDMGATAAPAAVVGSAVTGALTTDSFTKVCPILAADTDLYFTLKAATGGGAAGVYDVEIIVDWGI